MPQMKFHVNNQDKSHEYLPYITKMFHIKTGSQVFRADTFSEQLLFLKNYFLGGASFSEKHYSMERDFLGLLLFQSEYFFKRATFL